MLSGSDFMIDQLVGSGIHILVLCLLRSCDRYDSSSAFYLRMKPCSVVNSYRLNSYELTSFYYFSV